MNPLLVPLPKAMTGDTTADTAEEKGLLVLATKGGGEAVLSASAKSGGYTTPAGCALQGLWESVREARISALRTPDNQQKGENHHASRQ